MDIGNKLKKIRNDNNLTQKDFAKKFFVKENTISNYEKGVRNPSVEFLTQVCKKFGLTLDYFENNDKQESNPKDLIITTKYGKNAIFDTKQSCYLTPHMYDYIVLSEYGYHLVYNMNDKNEIVYSARIDNLGNVTEYDNFVLNSFGFDKNGNIPAYNKKLEKIVLINYKGEVLSEKFSRISRINQIFFDDDVNDYGIYVGFKNFNEDIHDYNLTELINYDGKKIPLTLNKIDYRTYKIEEFNNVDSIVFNIDKYGICLTYFVPENLFSNITIYQTLISHFIDNIVFANENEIKNNILTCINLFQILNKKLEINKLKLNNNFNIEKVLEKINKSNINKITQDYLKRNFISGFEQMFK